jgi:hypothetical protein
MRKMNEFNPRMWHRDGLCAEARAIEMMLVIELMDKTDCTSLYLLGCRIPKKTRVRKNNRLLLTSCLADMIPSWKALRPGSSITSTLSMKGDNTRSSMLEMNDIAAIESELALKYRNPWYRSRMLIYSNAKNIKLFW